MGVFECIRTEVKTQLEALRSCINDITGKDIIPNWLDNSSSLPIKEDPCNTMPSYSFLDHCCFRDAHLLVFAHLLKRQRIGVVDNAGQFLLNAGAIQWFFKKTECIQHILMCYSSFPPISFLLQFIVSSIRFRTITYTYLSLFHIYVSLPC